MLRASLRCSALSSPIMFFLFLVFFFFFMKSSRFPFYYLIRERAFKTDTGFNLYNI